jgi:hypothetical protein
MAGLLGLDDDQRGGLLGDLDKMNQTALGPLYAPRDPASLIGAGAGNPFDVPAPTGGRSLPADNYRKPLSEYAPTVYRQASASEVPDYIPGMRLNDKRYDDVHLADHPDMALGQGSNAGGVMMAFDPAGIHGQINRSKPTFEPTWQSGYGEYVGTKNSQEAYQGALTAMRIPTDLKMSRLEAIQMRTVGRRLEDAGWNKQQGDGYIEYLKPQP